MLDHILNLYRRNSSYPSHGRRIHRILYHMETFAPIEFLYEFRIPPLKLRPGWLFPSPIPLPWDSLGIPLGFLSHSPPLGFPLGFPWDSPGFPPIPLGFPSSGFSSHSLPFLGDSPKSSSGGSLRKKVKLTTPGGHTLRGVIHP